MYDIQLELDFGDPCRPLYIKSKPDMAWVIYNKQWIGPYFKTSHPTLVQQNSIQEFGAPCCTLTPLRQMAATDPPASAPLTVHILRKFQCSTQHHRAYGRSHAAPSPPPHLPAEMALAYTYYSSMTNLSLMFFHSSVKSHVSDAVLPRWRGTFSPLSPPLS